MRILYTHLSIALLALAPLLASAQQEMAPVWQQSPDHSIISTGLADEDDEATPQTYTYAASQKEITVYATSDGKTIWNKKFSEIAPKLGKVDDIIPMWESGVIILADRKLGADQLAGVDAITGQLLWITDKYQNVTGDNIKYLTQNKAFLMGLKRALCFVDARTGELRWETVRFKGAAAKYVEVGNGESIVLINYKPESLTAFFTGFKNQLMRISAKTGEVIWEQIYRGAIERKVVTREVLVKLRVEETSVVLMLNGIQVFDLETGKPKWSAAFDQTPNVIKRGIGGGALNVLGGGTLGGNRFGAYGTVAEPITTEQHVYVLDFDGKRKQYIKKYDRLTGALVWTSPEIDDAKAVPGMFLYKDVIVLQVGGTVEIQSITTTRQPGGGTVTRYVVDYDDYGPYNLQGFDGNTGKQLWQSEKLKKGIANAYMEGDQVIVASGKALYSMDYATGKEKYEVALKGDNISTANYIINFKDKVVVVGDKGVSTHLVSDGSLVKAGRYKRATAIRRNGKMIYGNSLALRNGDGDYAVYDLDACVYKKYDGRANARAMLSADGEALYVYEDGSMMRKSKVTRFATR